MDYLESCSHRSSPFLNAFSHDGEVWGVALPTVKPASWSPFCQDAKYGAPTLRRLKRLSHRNCAINNMEENNQEDKADKGFVHGE
jgi:hypothetical protein